MNTLKLPPILDLIAAPGLLEAFTSQRGEPLRVDGGGVQRLGGQCLQVLLAARAAWAADDLALLLDNISEEFAATLELLGATPDDLAYDRRRERADRGSKPEGAQHESKEPAA